jgi:DNA polymerase-3 subunit gamma/tau
VSRALYRKYRSKSLNEVVGQSHITDILARAIKAGRISHAYLLTGPRGVGKTSVARILAHEINQLPYSDDSTHLDIIEIDAASNNGVEDVRDLREKVQLAPVSAAKKIYIIDEVHMLSKAAFNALLKTLEEPPEHIVFILATTDADKLPATIVSRTQRYGFRAITTKDAVKHLRHIADEEKIKIDDDALAVIAERGDGSFRDSISLLDQLASLTDPKTGITADLIEATLGLAPTKVIDELLSAIDSHDVTEIAKILDQTIADGVSPVTLTEQLTQKLRSLIAEKPQLLPLLDTLLDVPKNSQPGLKLLATIGSFALEHKPTKSIALATPVLEVTATIEELTKQATRISPKLPKVSVEASEVSAFPVPLQPESALAQSPVKTRSEVRTEKAESSIDFNWETLIEFTKKNYVALYSVLSKCIADNQPGKLTLYTKSTFYKKKLDDPKYSAHLYESLQKLWSYEPSIHTVPTAPPPSSSQAASVAVIMGGGEEVSVEAS